MKVAGREWDMDMVHVSSCIPPQKWNWEGVPLKRFSIFPVVLPLKVLPGDYSAQGSTFWPPQGRINPRITPKRGLGLSL